LLLSKNGWYNRFTLEQRSDLQKLYKEYSDALIENSYEAICSIPCFFYKDKKSKKRSFRMAMIAQFERMIRLLKK